MSEQKLADKCPLKKQYGEIICINGTLWGLTYSEMGPPDSRQAIDDCPHCKRMTTVTTGHGGSADR